MFTGRGIYSSNGTGFLPYRVPDFNQYLVALTDIFTDKKIIYGPDHPYDYFLFYLRL